MFKGNPVRWLGLLAVSTALVGTLSACGGGLAPAAALPSSMPASITAQPPPNTSSPSSKSAQSNMPAPGGAFPLGTFTAIHPQDTTLMEFLEGGKYAAPDVGATGTFTATGNQIVLVEAEGPCKGIPGTYTWSFDGTNLTLTVVQDKCSLPRGSDLSRVWVKQP